jgi:Immunity protein 74
MPITYMTPSYIDYQFGDKSIRIDGEALVPTPGQPDYVIYAFSIRQWNPPHDSIAMTSSDKKMVLEEVTRDLRARGTVVDVEGIEYMTGLQVGLPERVPAPGKCPQDGFWLTPARMNSRRHFKVGEVMPDVGGDYGLTIWQWDENQT